MELLRSRLLPLIFFLVVLLGQCQGGKISEVRSYDFVGLRTPEGEPVYRYKLNFEDKELLSHALGHNVRDVDFYYHSTTVPTACECDKAPAFDDWALHMLKDGKETIHSVMRILTGERPVPTWSGVLRCSKCGVPFRFNLRSDPKGLIHLHGDELYHFKSYRNQTEEVDAKRLFVWVMNASEKARLLALLGDSFDREPMRSVFIGHRVTGPPSPCPTCGKLAEFVDWASTAVSRGFHTPEFVYRSLELGNQPKENMHDVFCSRCGEKLPGASRRPGTPPEIPSVFKNSTIETRVAMKCE